MVGELNEGKTVLTICTDQQQWHHGVCILYLYSRSCRSSTGSRPCGFWMGVMRFCFCWSWIMSEVCPGPCCCWGCWAWGCDWDCGVRDVLGVTWAAVGAWGGAGEGLPLGAGTGSFWEPLHASAPWPKISDEEAVTKWKQDNLSWNYQLSTIPYNDLQDRIVYRHRSEDEYSFTLKDPKVYRC